MKIGRRKYFLGVGSFLVFIAFLEFLNQETFPGHKELQGLLINSLTKYEPLPSALYKSQSNSGSVIYVLGGSPQSLKGRFKTASNLYKDGVASKILIDDDLTMMEYSPSIGRNLTFNEWAIENLVGLGVKKEDIEPVLLEKGLFGTFSEAKSVSRIMKKRGYHSLVLVTSPYHTMRTWKSFSKFLKGHGINLYVYMSDEKVRLRYLLLEYLKLIVYKIFLL